MAEKDHRMFITKQLKTNFKILFFLLLTHCVLLKGQQTELRSLAKYVQELASRSQYDSVISYSDILLSKAKKVPDTMLMTSALTSKAAALLATSKTKEALKLYYSALELCRDSALDKQKAFIYNRLGSLNFEQGNIALAKQFFKQEINLRESRNEKIPVANNYINLSSVHRALKEYDSSAALLSKAQRLLLETKDKKLKAYFHNAKAVHFHSLFRRDSLPYQLDSALLNYRISLDTWKEIGNLSEAFKPLFNLGHAYHARKQFQTALEYYKEAEKIVSALNLAKERTIILGNISELYYDLKDFRQSADYFRKYIELKDSLQKAEIKSYALELDKRFETEKQKQLIRDQKLEIAQQEIKITEQGKRIYLSLFLIVLVLAAALFIFIYFNFQKRLEKKTEEVKKKFFSNVVHEIRTPLSMIQAPLQVLKEKYKSEEDKYNIDVAERNIKRLNELASQMLDISKMESLSYTLNETYGDLEQFFRQMINGYSKIAAEKNSVILSQFSFGQKLAYFDKDALEKIAGNLLSNAIKYTPGNKQLGIDIYTYNAESGIRLVFNVWDTGPGIPEKELEKIFTRFYRSSSTAAGTKGAGIGLSLVKDLVDVMKGTIRVKSDPGKGSVFSVELSLRVQQEEPAAAATDEGAPLIMLVEDDLEILEFNANYLSKKGFSVVKATNGHEALGLLGRILPDLVITDLMMPGMDGIALLKEIRGNDITDHIPVIVLSAKASAEPRMEVLQLGAQAHLAKPFLPEELTILVKNQLDIIHKKKSEFKEQAEKQDVSVREKYTGNDPYTRKLFTIVFDNLDNPELSVEKLADMMAANRSHFQRKVKALTGISPSDLIRQIRLEKAKEFLYAKKGNVTEVAYMCGFSSQSYFTKSFTQHFGVSPTQMLQSANS